MMNSYPELSEWGWSEWFAQRVHCSPHHAVARVAAVDRDQLLLIDTPGMREFGILGAETGLAKSYANITTLASRCRFQDCSHTGEPGCAVLAAIQAGEISQESLNGFLKLKQEASFNDMSYAEKRKKDRDFGKFLKSVKKDLRDR